MKDNGIGTAGDERPVELPLVPLLSSVLYPFDVAPFQIHLPATTKLLSSAGGGGDRVILYFLGSAEETLAEKNLPVVGLSARILDRIAMPNESYQVTFQGLNRILVTGIVKTEPFPVVRVEPVREREYDREVLAKLARQVVERCELLAEADQRYSQESVQILRLNLGDPGRLADLVAGGFGLELAGRRKILQLVDVEERLKALLPLLDHEVKKSRLLSELVERTKTGIEESERKQFLKQQLEVIKAELGEATQQEIQHKENLARLESVPLPPDVKQRVRREIERLGALAYASQDYSDALSYVRDWVLRLPWKPAKMEPMDVAKVRLVLDNEHFGIRYVKDKIIEYLSVLKLKPDYTGPTLCLVGPAGTGKTSVAQSIAKGLGRKFATVSFKAGALDSDVLGTDRNYYEAAPGKVIQAIRDAGTMDPVIVLDSIDGISEEDNQETVLALYDLLDPTKRDKFVDRYLGFPYDLSHVLFLTTASVDYDIASLLLERLELVHLAGYTGAEKLAITLDHLLPARIESHGLSSSDLVIGRKVLKWLIHSYTREAGLTELTALLDIMCRRRAAEKVAGEPYEPKLGLREIKRYLGQPRYPRLSRKPEVGVATGLAWTSEGGDLLIIEALKMRGKGELICTGQLGQVMEESVKAAHSYVRSRAEMLGIKAKDVQTSDIHIHFPEGAIPKDGPSAGVAATLAIASILSDKPIRADLAVTGEVTLTGKVLGVGGIREKLMAAYRAGAHEVILPKQNEEDLRDVPEDVLSKMKLIMVERMDEVLEKALEDAGSPQLKTGPEVRRRVRPRTRHGKKKS
jgi:ATP-dependent Lon protease